MSHTLSLAGPNSPDSASQPTNEPKYWFQRWQALDRFLSDHEIFWRPIPFTQPEPEWREYSPGLAAWTDRLVRSECDHLEADTEAMADQVTAFLPGMARRHDLVSLPDLGGPERALPEVLAPGMPGRKRKQAGAFASALQPVGHPVVDWCCGKGHLARTLAAHTDQPITGLEWNQHLVAAGNQLAQRFGEAVTFYQQDVMADDDLMMPHDSHMIALHACGDLHRRLLWQGATRQVPRLSLSPCCFQKSVIDADKPLSQRIRAQTQACKLTRNERQLAVEETVTAPKRERAQTDRMRTWRLGFDGLQRHLRGIDAYLSVPSHPSRLQHGSFADFCRWAAQRKDLALPANTDFDRWQHAGAQRLDQVRRQELVRHLFRRPMELWLVLDLVLFLEEQDYRVKLGTFCERALTPRNLLLDAQWVG